MERRENEFELRKRGKVKQEGRENKELQLQGECPAKATKGECLYSCSTTDTNRTGRWWAYVVSPAHPEDGGAKFVKGPKGEGGAPERTYCHQLRSRGPPKKRKCKKRGGAPSPKGRG